ncbi:MAG: hypothetical protein H0T41_15600 [Rhodobacteraceae bacterium]|nr:hypothetical protein [Paracoccaceae bacterium]
MFNFRAFSRSLDPEGGRYAAGDMTPTELSGERMVFDAVVERGPFRGKALTLTYEGDSSRPGKRSSGRWPG